MSSFSPGALYPILDVTPERPPDRALELAEVVLAAAVPWLQLRAKALASGPLLDLTRVLVQLAARFGAKVIVNDRLDVALAAGAAGVHLGQGDLPAPVAREVAAGHSLVIGVSTHSVDEELAAERDGADYVGFGPMFPTSSKADALAPRRAGELRAVRAAIGLPIVAIGGINETTAGDVLAAGASSVAMISALATHPDAAALTRRLLNARR